MGFYDLDRKDRFDLVKSLRKDLMHDFRSGDVSSIREYFSDSDVYIRQKAYLACGRIYKTKKKLRAKMLAILNDEFKSSDKLIRQTIVHCFGEIGKVNPEDAVELFESALSDKSWRVRNTVVGSLKVIGEGNPKHATKFARQFIKSKDPTIRRVVLHGLELRGRTHPQDILPILKMVQWENDSLVRQTLVHVLAQISYQKGCLEKVVKELASWENRQIVEKAA